MKRRDFIRLASAATAGTCAFPWGFSAAADDKPRRKILYFTRNCGYYHSVVRRKGDELAHSEKALIRMGRKAGVDVVCSNDGRVFDGDFDQYDAFAFYCNGDLTKENGISPPMSQDGKKRLMDAVAAGKGLIGFHSTCACWRTAGDAGENLEKLGPFLKMLGGEFVTHGPQQVATMRVTSPNFPGIKGLGDSFALMEEWYALKNFAKDLHVILVQETGGMQGGCYQRGPYPSTWARMHGAGRVFFTSMAHREQTWDGNPLEQIVLGGMAWTLKNVDADITPNIETVTPEAWKLTR